MLHFDNSSPFFTSFFTSSLAHVDDDARDAFRDLTKATEPDLRALNAVIFPVRYGDKFYEDCARAVRARSWRTVRMGRAWGRWRVDWR